MPSVYASNRTYGSGNDKQAVYYWYRLVTPQGALVRDWQYAGASWANDNAATQFPITGRFGVTKYPYLNSFRLTGSNTVKIEYFVRWYDADLVFLGDAHLVLNSYQLWAFGTANQIGLAAAC